MPRYDLPCDVELSEHLAQIVGAEPKSCWMNSVKIVMQEWPKNTPLYIEGFVVVTLESQNGKRDSVLPVRHAWIEVDGEVILEPTLVLSFSNIARTMAGTSYTRVSFDYFPAVKFGKLSMLTGIEKQFERCDTTRFPLCTKEDGPLSKNALRFYWANLEALSSIGILGLVKAIAKTVASKSRKIACKIALKLLSKRRSVSIPLET